MYSQPKRSAALLAAIIFLAATALSQEFRATLSGRVTDASGGAVSGAKVTVKNLKTNEESTATTNGEGYYTAPFLLPSDYGVTVEAGGYKRAVSGPLTLNVNDKRTLDLALEVGQLEQTVNVTSDAPLLEVDTATRGAVIENLRVTELPLNAGRNPINFVNLSPGVQFSGNPQFFRPFDNGDNVQFSINGGLVRHNEYLIDGAPNNAVTDADLARTRSSNNIAFVPPTDATQEFKVMTNTYDAQYGRTSGGIINVTTKSGGAAFHGAGYEFLRRYQLDANDTASNRAGRPRYSVEPGSGRNLGGHLLDDYGGTITGPLWLPGSVFGPLGYDARNKTFFMFTFQGYRESAPSVGVTNTPTALERAGDFSQSAFKVYDPLTTRLNPAFDPSRASSAGNPQYLRNQFPGNVIPANRINPISAALVNSLPLPNFGAAGASFNNFLNSPGLGTEKFRSYVARVDQNFGENERMFFRYAHNRRDQFGFGANALPETSLGLDAQDPLVRLNDGGVVDSVTTLSSRTILDMRVTYTRFIQAAYRTRSSPFDATSIGFPSSFSSARPVSIVPRVDIEQYYCCGSGNGFGPRNPSQNTTNTISFQPSLSHVAGGHSFKFGGEVRDLRVNSSGASFSFGGGHFLFDRYFTRQFPDFSDTSGNAIAELLLGYPSNDPNGVDNLPKVAFRWGYYAGYVQDDWKVTRKLTLNLGLRYDYEGAPTERYDRQNRGFAFDQASPLAAQIAGRPGFSECPSCANLKGGLLFAGVGGQDRAAFDADTNNVQPRVGAAYRLFENTVLRGGYGLFYLPQAEFGGTTGYSVSTPVVATTGGGLNAFLPTLSLSNPFPNGLLQPTGSSLGLLTQAGTGVVFNLPTRRIPKTHQFSFGVQQQLPWSMRLDVAYAGSRSVDLLTGDFNIGGARNINVLPAATIERARVDPAFNTFLNASVPNPFAGLLPGTSLNGATVPRSQLLLPYPQFTSVVQGLENVGKIWYNSLQVSLEKRLSSGLTFVGAYTWSKAIGALTFLNDQDAAPARAVTDDDRTHRLALSGVWQLPVGKGRRFAGGAGRLTELLVGGWEYTWIATIQSGRPLNLPGNVDLIGDINAGGGGLDRYFNTCVLPFGATQARRPNATNTGFESCGGPAFAIRGPNTLRTIPLRSSQVRLPSRPQFDMSLNKSFNFTETIRFQFRLESFNTFNTPIYGGPNTDPTSTSFGLVTRNQANQPRNVQLGFKLIF
jgi:hypothetical protein